MATIIEGCAKLKGLLSGIVPMVEKEMHKDPSEFSEYITEQLYSGVDGDENPLRPTYTNDPYFTQKYGTKAEGAARGYMKWKQKLTTPTPSYLGFSARDPDTPNLIIRGDFYSSIRAVPISGGVRIETQGLSFGSDVVNKYGLKIFKVSRRASSYYIKYRLKPAISNYLKVLR